MLKLVTKVWTNKYVFLDTKQGRFVLVDSGGTVVEEEQIGLLLYKGGTVCDDDFNERAADAICRDMNYVRSTFWTSGDRFDIQTNYEIGLDNLNCSTGEWHSCTFTRNVDCHHEEDVFLSCSSNFLINLLIHYLVNDVFIQISIKSVLISSWAPVFLITGMNLFLVH